MMPGCFIFILNTELTLQSRLIASESPNHPVLMRIDALDVCRGRFLAWSLAVTELDVRLLILLY